MENKEMSSVPAKNAYILNRKPTIPPILSFEKHILKTGVDCILLLINFHVLQELLLQ